MKYFIASLLSLFIFSCSRVELIYQFAPKVVADKVDEAFDFKSERYKDVRHQIEDDFKTNKKVLIRNITELLDVLSVMSVKENLTLKDFQALSLDIRQKQKNLILLFKPSFEKVILNLNEDEVKNLIKYSSKTIEKSDEQLRERKPFVDKRVENFVKLMDYFFDDATSDQKALYGDFIRNNFEYFKSQSVARREFILQFSWPIQSKEKLKDYVILYYASDSSVRTSTYATQLALFEKNLIQLQYDIWLTINKKQKDYFQVKLITLKTDLLKLAEK